MSNTTRLSDVPSELLRQTANDLQLCINDNRYRINMDEWHISNKQGYDVCDVCMAGAVMAQSLHVGVMENCDPEFFNDDIQNKLRVINYFRTGRFILALLSMRIYISEGQSQHIINYWNSNLPDILETPEDLVILAKGLEELGL